MRSVNRPRQGPAGSSPRANAVRVSDHCLSLQEQLVQLERERHSLLQRKDQLLDETVDGDHTDNQLLTVLHRLRGVAQEIERVRAVHR